MRGYIERVDCVNGFTLVSDVLAILCVQYQAFELMVGWWRKSMSVSRY